MALLPLRYPIAPEACDTQDAPANGDALAYSDGEFVWTNAVGAGTGFSGAAAQPYLVMGADAAGTKMSNAPAAYSAAVNKFYFLSFVDITGGLQVSGASGTYLKGTLATSDGTTLYSTVNVGGVSTFSGAVVMSSTLGVKGAVTLSNKNISDDSAVVLSFGSGKVTKIGDHAPADGEYLCWCNADTAWYPKVAVGGGTFSGAVAQNYVAIGADAAGTKLSNLPASWSAGTGFFLSTPLGVQSGATFSAYVWALSYIGIRGGIDCYNSAWVGATFSVFGDCTVSGATTLYSMVNIGGATVISNSLGVSNAATFYSTVNVGGEASFSNSVVMSSSLNVKGNAVFSNTVMANSNILAYTTVNIGGATTISNSLAVSNAATLYSTVNVGGAATFSGAVVMSSTLGVKGAVTLSNKNISDDSAVVLSFGSGKVTKIGDHAPADGEYLCWCNADTAWYPKVVAGGGTFSGAVTDDYVAIGADAAGTLLSNAPMYLVAGPGLFIPGGFGCSNDATLYSGCTVKATLNVGGTATLSGAVVMSSTLGVKGAATLSNTLAVTSNAYATGTFSVGGAATFSSTVVTSNTVDVAGASTLRSTVNVGGVATFSDAVVMSSTLGVKDATTLSNTVNIGGATTISNSLAVSNAATLYSTVNIGGVATFSGAVVMSSTCGIKGALTLSNENITDGTGVVLSFGSGKVTKIGDHAPADQEVLTWCNADTAWYPKVGGGGAGTFSGNVAQNYVAIGADAAGTLLSNTVMYHVAGPLVSVLGGIRVSNATTLYSTVNVGGAATFSGTVNVGGVTTFSDAVVMSSTLGVKGAATLSNTLAVTSNLYATGTFSVGGAATFSAAVVMSSTLGVKGACSFSGFTYLYTGAYIYGDYIKYGDGTHSGLLSLGSLNCGYANWYVLNHVTLNGSNTTISSTLDGDNENIYRLIIHAEIAAAADTALMLRLNGSTTLNLYSNFREYNGTASGSGTLAYTGICVGESIWSGHTDLLSDMLIGGKSGEEHLAIGGYVAWDQGTRWYKYDAMGRHSNTAEITTMALVHAASVIGEAWLLCCR